MAPSLWSLAGSIRSNADGSRFGRVISSGIPPSRDWSPARSVLIPTFATVDDQRAATAAYVPDQKLPYAETWSLGVQRELTGNWIVDVSYVGSKGTKLFLQEDYNPLVPAALRKTPTTTTPKGRRR